MKYGDHTFEPVPIALGLASKINETLESGSTPKVFFDEMSCGSSKLSTLGRFPGKEIMPLLKRYRASLLQSN